MNEITKGKGVLALDLKNFCVSDDTVMHLATAEGLVSGEEDDKLLCKIGMRYIDCWGDMGKTKNKISIAKNNFYSLFFSIRW